MSKYLENKIFQGEKNLKAYYSSFTCATFKSLKEAHSWTEDSWALVKLWVFFISKRGFEYISVLVYWIMNERDSTLEALLLVSNEPISQGRRALCTGVRGGQCFRGHAYLEGFLTSACV